MFGGYSNQSTPSSLPSLVRAAMGDPQGLFDQMMRDNPQFRQFVDDNRGKTPEQIARDNGIDFAEVMRLLPR